MHIVNRLEECRKSRGLSGAKLATLVGTTRQTIHAIEAGKFIPNTTLALQIARALDAAVEQIFSLPTGSPPRPISAELLEAPAPGAFVRLARVNRRLVAVPASAMPSYLPSADGVLERRSRRTVTVNVPSPVALEKRLLLAGCDPALSSLNELLQRSGIEIVTVPASSRRALKWLKQGRVHVAGSHLLDRTRCEYNLPIIRRLFPPGVVKVVTFAAWEEGLVVRPGNPKEIRSIADLGRKGITLMNRDQGSGSRDLLDAGLKEAGIPAARVHGYDSAAAGHLPAAYAVASATADCCIAPRSAARCFGLDFIPLASERFDLAFTRESFDSPATRALLDLLNRSQMRKKLQLIAGYETAQTGQVLL